MPMKRRPCSFAARSAEPEPKNGSTTRFPALENAWISGVRTQSGFCVACNLLAEYFHSSTSGTRMTGKVSAAGESGCKRRPSAERTRFMCHYRPRRSNAKQSKHWQRGKRLRAVALRGELASSRFIRTDGCLADLRRVARGSPPRR
jgi:hypothetical protein